VTTDPIHAQSPTNTLGSERDREARVEELLLSGLDHYFAGQHELAINVWTRALFIDRGHARARAYIERARGALAERQREGEELIHTGAAAFERGEAETARRLLMAAVEQGTITEEALALLDRIDRLRAAGVPRELPSERSLVQHHSPATSAARAATDRGSAGSPPEWSLASPGRRWGSAYSGLAEMSGFRATPRQPAKPPYTSGKSHCQCLLHPTYGSRALERSTNAATCERH
jgi:hypothetical protein